jgi:hypothetical protein
MYVTPTKTLGVEALQHVFDNLYPTAEWRGVHCSLEYPIEATSFPEIWVTYSDTDKAQKMGVRHQESLDPVAGTVVQPFTRWKFSGTLTFTVAALTSLQCDRLYDELLRVVAFGSEDPVLGRFRQYIEGNDLVYVVAQWDEVESAGDSAAPGTPWGTDEVVYERSMHLDVKGEFYPDPVANTLVPLSKIVVTPTPDLSIEPDINSWH